MKNKTLTALALAGSLALGSGINSIIQSEVTSLQEGSQKMVVYSAPLMYPVVDFYENGDRTNRCMIFNKGLSLRNNYPLMGFSQISELCEGEPSTSQSNL